PGDCIRTLAHSRAAVQLSDRSVVRLDELTTLEILPPRHQEKKRFGLPQGALYFFNRERPADVEFETPLASGAIRGTEFLLEAGAATGTHLALIDGAVGLHTAQEDISLQRGEEVRLQSGRLAEKTALVNANAKIQWAMYYPLVLVPADLGLTAGERTDLSRVLDLYQAGDVLGALAAWPPDYPTAGVAVRSLRRQLDLAVGQVSTPDTNITAGLAAADTALNELIAVVQGNSPRPTRPAQTASQALADSYAWQAAFDLPRARSAAAAAVALAPTFGGAHARLAELEFALGNRRAATVALATALTLAPRLASAQALQGFVALEAGDQAAARKAFQQALQTDAALGEAWLGQGLCLIKQGNYAAARQALQTAAALEPQRGLFRSYLGKAAGEMGDTAAAAKEFRLAKELDAGDPTAWLYSALELWQLNQLNAAIRELEIAYDKNDNRAAFRSREALDMDRSVRSADQALVYADAGLGEVSRHRAMRAVAESYANFSGHLYLADSYQAAATANRFDLRLETAQQSELLVANLLAPPGAGNLSQVLSQADRLRFFEQKPFGVSSYTTYGSRGDWTEAATVFGTVDNLSYAFDTVYRSINGQYFNNDSEARQFNLTLKDRITADDDLYFQIGDYQGESGDVQSHYDPATAAMDFRVQERQEPDLYAGWHHAWSPGSHTLLMFSRLPDKFQEHNGNSDLLFLQTSLFSGDLIGVQNGPLNPYPAGNGPLALAQTSHVTLYSVDLQQIYEQGNYSLIAGGRWQWADDEAEGQLSQINAGLPQTVTDQHLNGYLERGDAYAYASWQVWDPLRLVAGINYSHLRYPRNFDLPPLANGEATRDLISPKLGLLFQPWQRGLLRAAWTRSLGGLYFDNSVRLEPTEVGGFNQAYRSLLPESVAGLIPGSTFETLSVGFDQSLPTGTFFGVEAEQLSSWGARDAGSFTFFAPILSADEISQTREKLDYRERNLSLYAAQLLGDRFSASARYRLSESTLKASFPGIPDGTSGLEQLEQNERALLNSVALALNFHHPGGFFAQWESVWYQQNNFGYAPARASEGMWQHNLMLGWRFARRHAEARLSLLNLTDTDYRLNPLNLMAELPRGRALVASLRLNF
ncbi:MAG TPA: FecR domain-containing protein, partial [Verrucomicrobiae bacterium]